MIIRKLKANGTICINIRNANFQQSVQSVASLRSHQHEFVLNTLMVEEKKRKKKNLAIFTSLLRLPRETICVCQGWGSSGVSSSRLGRSLVPHKFGGILESDKTDGTPLLLCFRDIRTSSSSIQPHNCHTLNYPK